MSLPPPPLDPQPVQVEPLGYHVPVPPPLPGLLVAVGIVSIVVAVLSILSSCSGIGQTIAFGAMSSAVITPPTTGPAAPVVLSRLPSLARMSAGEQRIIATELAGRHALSPGRMEMLDLLLTQCADDVISFASPNITQESVAGTIVQTGEIPAGDGSKIAFYVLVNGRIEVGDDDAVFSPTGAKPSVRVNRSQLGPSTTVHSNAFGGGASSTVVTTSSGGATSVVVTAGPAVAFAAPSGGRLGMLIFALATTVISLLLAILVLVAGILVLMHRRLGRKLHLFYAWTKVPVAIAGAVASHQMMTQAFAAMTPAMGATMGAAGPMKIMAIQSMVYAVIACIYPVALLIVFRTRTVCEYYQNITTR